MPTVRIPITLDASVTQQYPSKNYGAYKDLAVESASPSRQAFLWAALPAIAGKTIVSARLVGFERYTYGGGSRQLTVWLLGSRFNEKTINFTNRPAVLSGAPTAATTQGDAAAAGRRWEWNVTALIQHVADGAPWYGMRITSTNATKWFMWSSEAASEFRPYLEIEYAGPPEKPQGLSPAGGRAVSVERPLHRFAFIDTSDDALTGFQIQWAASENGFGTPTLDTGIVDSIVPQWSPTADVNVDQVIWWRVRTRDSAGLWSVWSDPVEFTRKGKSAVTLVSPLDEGTVAEPTPPIVWSTSGTQTAFQVFLTDPVTGGLLHNSGKLPGAETAWTPPAGILTNDLADYRVTVRAWDDVARESTPGDPAYVEDAATFTLELADSVAPVTNLSAAVSDHVGVVFSWSRSTMPDGFLIRVDGEFLEDEIDPASVLVSGSDYTYEWWGAQPRRKQVVEVVPVVNGEAAGDNPSVTVEPEPLGIWLSGTDGENAIMLTATGEGDWSDTTISAVHQSIGSPFPAIRTQVLGARSARISGVLSPDELPTSKTMDQWIADAHALRDPPGQLLRLVKTGINIVGVVDQLRIDPVSEYGRVAVSFTFYEQAP